MTLTFIGIRNVAHAEKLKNGLMSMKSPITKYILLKVLLLEGA